MPRPFANALDFTPSPEPTLGVEIELAIVDGRSMALASSAPGILAALPAEPTSAVTSELMQCQLELKSGVCRTVAEAHADLGATLGAVEAIADRLGVGLYWSGTHPFSSWRDQIPTPDERYARLLEQLQEVGRQLVVFGLHVHVGVDSGDSAVQICDRIASHVPGLLALSCNSPFWENGVTGLLSHRSKIMEAFPTSGLPPPMKDWSDYASLVERLYRADFIRSLRDLWWVVRPRHDFGTVEVRVCDIPGSLDDALALAALIHSLVRVLSEEIREGVDHPECEPFCVRQNMWRAARFGLQAKLMDFTADELRPARAVIVELCDRLEARELDKELDPYFNRLREMAVAPTWAEQQLAILAEGGSKRELVSRMVELSRRGGALRLPAVAAAIPQSG